MTQVSDDKMKMKSNGKRPFSPGNSPRWRNLIHPKNNTPVPDTTGVWWPTLGMDTRYILVNWREVRQEIFRLDLQNRSGLSILYWHKHSNLTTRQASWKWKGGNYLCGVLEIPSSKRLYIYIYVFIVYMYYVRILYGEKHVILFIFLTDTVIGQNSTSGSKASHGSTIGWDGLWKNNSGN